MTVRTISWQEEGNCWDTDPGVFFDSEPGGWPAAVFQICADCPVTRQCLDFALTNFSSDKDRGIWGGTTARQRRRLRKTRSAA